VAFLGLSLVTVFCITTYLANTTTYLKEASFPRHVTKFHSTTKILVQYSPWVSIIAVDVISYSSLSLSVGRFIWGGEGRGYMDLAQIHISIVLLLHYSATCFNSCLCCAVESRSAREASISVIFQWIVAGWDPEWECDCRKNTWLHTTHTLQETRFLKHTIGLLSP